MSEHWDAGRADMAHTLHDPRWVNHDCSMTGVHVFDLTSDTPFGEGSCGMNSDEVRRSAVEMPLTSPAFAPGPYRFVDREFLIVTYRTARDALREVVPEPLQVTEPIVNYELMRPPDSIDSGDYTRERGR